MVFVTNTAAILAVLVGLGLPLWIVAWRRRRRDTIRNFGIGAVVVAALVGIVEITSDRAVEECLAAGNPDCLDSGSAGMQLVMVAFYALVNWFVAYKIWTE